MTFALRRGGQWITAPDGDAGPIPPTLVPGDDLSKVWIAPDIDIAHKRQALVRMCWGWSTEIRRFPSP
jgi:hypothetical protein